MMVSLVMQAVGSLGAAVVLDLTYSWRFSIALVLLVPFIAIGSFAGNQGAGPATRKGQKALEEAGKVWYSVQLYFHSFCGSFTHECDYYFVALRLRSVKCEGYVFAVFVLRSVHRIKGACST